MKYQAIDVNSIREKWMLVTSARYIMKLVIL